MVNVWPPIETQLCLSPKSHVPRYVHCFITSVDPTATVKCQAVALLSTRQSCRNARAMSGSVSVSPCVSQKDTLSFKFYGSYLWLKYHLWQFPSAKLQKWYSFIAKGCYGGPKLQAKSWVESECMWTPSHRKLSLFQTCPFSWHPLLCEYVKAPKRRASWLPLEQSKELGSCNPGRSTPFLILRKKAEGLLPPSFSDSYRLATHLIKDWGLPGHSLLAISCSQSSIHYKGTGDECHPLCRAHHRGTSLSGPANCENREQCRTAFYLLSQDLCAS